MKPPRVMYRAAATGHDRAHDAGLGGRVVLRWLPLEAVKASNWNRVNLGDTDELVGGLIGSKGVMWPRLVADTVCGRLTRTSVSLVVCRGGL